MKLTPILLALCFSITVFSQDYRFGKVSKEELKEQFNPLDSSARATFLFKERKTFYEYDQNDGFTLVTEVLERIKIYNQDGFDYATKSNRLYVSGGNEEELRNLKAYTYNLVDGKIEETKLSKEGIFKTELSKYRNEYKFTMPNINAGCIVEYKYRINSPFIYNVDEFVFQHDIPVKKLEAKFSAPEFYNFKLSTKGYLSVIPKKSTLNDRITFTSKSRGDGGTTFSTDDLTFVKNVTEYSLVNVPALKDEPYVNNIDNYRAAVNYELSYVKYPNSPAEPYSTTWEDVVKTIYSSSSFGTELNKKGYFEDDIDALISSVSNPVQKVALIFNYVKSHVKWNGYYGYSTDKGVRKAYKDQVGNTAEINLMLTSMLQYAGLRAYPVLISTRENGVPLFPTIEGYNYVISYVKLDEGEILLDATDKYSIPNVLPYRTLNWQGRIIAEQGGSRLIDLYPRKMSKNTVFFMANLKENGDISGGVRKSKTAHDALFFRQKIGDVDREDYIEKLENNYNGLEISDYEIKNEGDLGKPVLESYKFLKESQADIIGDKIYFSPLFFLKTTENPFKLEEREFPVDFGYPSETSYMVNISIPEGYKIESLPETSAFMMPDDLGVYSFKILQSGNNIQLTINSQTKQPIIGAQYYGSLKAYYTELVEKENEQIVLSRI
jgi:transglutaminase-like putative cysteine protease